MPKGRHIANTPHDCGSWAESISKGQYSSINGGWEKVWREFFSRKDTGFDVGSGDVSGCVEVDANELPLKRKKKNTIIMIQ